MIKKIIQDQLDRCTDADLSNFDEENYRYIIPKKTTIQLSRNKEYIIELSKDCLDSNSIVNINWNNGKAPTRKYYKISINDIKGKVINVDALAFDYDNNKDIFELWSGWLSIKDIIVLKEL